MNWKVTFFNDKVVKETHNFPNGILANSLRIVEIIILHSFVKKTQKTPKKELDIARKRLKEV